MGDNFDIKSLCSYGEGPSLVLPNSLTTISDQTGLLVDRILCLGEFAQSLHNKRVGHNYVNNRGLLRELSSFLNQIGDTRAKIVVISHNGAIVHIDGTTNKRSEYTQDETDFHALLMNHQEGLISSETETYYPLFNQANGDKAYICVKHSEWTSNEVDQILQRFYTEVCSTSKREQETIEHLTQDSLTEAKNKLFFESIKDDRDYSVAFSIDLDRLKGINDTYGHDVGDKVIKEVTRLIGDQLRADDDIQLIRFGGDEFCIVAKNLNVVTTQHLVDRISEAFNGAVVRHRGIDIPLSISLGYSIQAEGKIKTVEELYKDADVVMYNAKEAKKAKTSALMLIIDCITKIFSDRKAKVATFQT